ncbi:MAG: hypothetical protein NTV81_00730, partial [Candidatus Komeilibacteria bacterium]|nr:hypothetical protein [Candidatus Komeilibacteria bacterium]
MNDGVMFLSLAAASQSYILITTITGNNQSCPKIPSGIWRESYRYPPGIILAGSNNNVLSPGVLDRELIGIIAFRPQWMNSKIRITSIGNEKPSFLPITNHRLSEIQARHRIQARLSALILNSEIQDSFSPMISMAAARISWRLTNDS